MHPARLSLYVFGILLIAVAANAQPVTWYVQGVTFNDGGTASGSFNYDAATNTYSQVQLTTTPGTVRTTGASYGFVCGQDVPTCNGINPASGSDVLNLTSNAGDQTGLPGFALFFTPALSDFGGTLVTGGQEANCSNAACSAPVAPQRSVVSGSTGSSETLQQYFAFGA